MLFVARGVATALVLGLSAPALADTSYTPPEVAQGDNGWETYIDSRMLDANSAAGLKPEPTSPEAAVVLFLASRIRGDSAWKDAVVDSPGRKTNKALKAWNDWTLNAAQIRARKMKGEDRGYMRVWIDITVDGDTDSGTDDFTFKREGDGWRISEVPS